MSTSVAIQLVNTQREFLACSMQVAGGGFLQSTAIIRRLQWNIDGCSFLSDFRVLDLAAFDMVVGMDWLVCFSPMTVHWSEK